MTWCASLVSGYGASDGTQDLLVLHQVYLSRASCARAGSFTDGESEAESVGMRECAIATRAERETRASTRCGQH